MRHQNERGPVPLLQAEKKIGDRGTIGPIEIAGWFIGQEQLWPWCRSPRKRHTLLLSPRHLGGKVVPPVPKAHGRQLCLCAVKGVLCAPEFQRDGHVFERRHGGDQVEGLKDNAHMLPAEAGQIVLGHRAKVLA